MMVLMARSGGGQPTRSLAAQTRRDGPALGDPPHESRRRRSARLRGGAFRSLRRSVEGPR